MAQITVKIAQNLVAIGIMTMTVAMILQMSFALAMILAVQQTIHVKLEKVTVIKILNVKEN